MQLHGLLDALRHLPAYQSLIAALRAGRPIPEQHVLRAARPFVAAAVAADLARPTLIITAQVERAYNITEQLPVWLPTVPTLRFAEPSALFYDRTPWAAATIKARLTALAALCPPIGTQAPEPPPLIITSALGLMSRTAPVREFRAASRLIRVGARIEPEKLLRFWLSIGYLPAAVVTEPGTFTRRGGVIDIFPISADRPVRIELFGDEIESLRAFDPASQRSVSPIDHLIVAPAREAMPKFSRAAAEKLANWFASLPEPETDVASARADHPELMAEAAFPTLEFYLPTFYSTSASLLDYLPDEALVIVDDWTTLEDTVGALEAQAVELYSERRRANGIPADYPLPYLTWEHLRDGLRGRPVLQLGGHSADSTPDEDALGMFFAPGNHFGGQIRPFIEGMANVAASGAIPIIVSNQAQRLAELWGETRHVTRLPVTTEIEALPDGVRFIEGALGEGWTLRDSIHLYTDAEIFGWRRPEPRRHITPRAISPEAYFADLKPGDYVVHIEYGVGRFMGMQKRQVDGNPREYLILHYANNDTLYVPIHQADRISRYVGPDDRNPNLTRLGSSEWAQNKAAAQRAAEESAREMLELYARRAMVRGHAFSPDTQWQAELEASFPYVETADQLRVLKEVKADMERPAPMDRLICGDVGYGKTEVALRAAFKAVMDGKQVAILVPTTVLAQQHYNTFTQRLAAFPVRVEMLSRFRSPKEQTDILAKVQRGEIDILIGTHRLLQDDVIFRDLGLLVIDEEQRFGVTHKERFKRLRTEIDVLTLTATPIPRTLYMSLAGIRDISMIQTPPAERLPVLTHVGPFDEKLVRQAILREIDRGGQVFFVHNRVSTIHSIADQLQRLVPDARIAIGHGQMHEDELERVMLSFANGEQDILLCTTIIESGLDIPNANTIIIDRGDMFGLAQLYQLRGRVGRGAYRAYAYLFYPRNAHLNPDARARLETIAEQTELGAGLSIAMRDLEIRGAGELLGMRQSGHIASVGFQLYTQMLAQAVNRLKAEHQYAAPAPLEPTLPGIGAPMTIDLPVPAYVPVGFMSDGAMRLQFYRRLADMHTLEAVDEMEIELRDRFGALPPEVEGLIYQMRVKLMAQAANVVSITSDDSQIAVKLPYLAKVDRAGLQRYLENGVRVSRVAVWLARDPNGAWRKRLLDVLERLSPLKERQPA
jgi:transcription-repair coupling factor (superfamily II helicase)